MWLSVGADLKIDSRRDLDDVGAPDVEVYALNKMPYQDLDTAKVKTCLLYKLQEQSWLLPNVLPWQRCTHAHLGTARVTACLLACLWPKCSAPAVLLTSVLRPCAVSQPAVCTPQHTPWPACLVSTLPIGLLWLTAPSVAPAHVD